MVKDLSDANRAVNRLKQTEDVGLPIHAIPLVNLRTVSISDAALDLDRPDRSTQGGFVVGFTTSALHQQGLAVMSPMSWSSHKVKRSVSASLAGEVFMMSEVLAANGSAVCWGRRFARRACGDRHEGGQPSAD